MYVKLPDGSDDSCALEQELEAFFSSRMAANDGEEATVSLVDVLEENEELENEASAVLGGSDSEKCSYPEVMHCLLVKQDCVMFPHSWIFLFILALILLQNVSLEVKIVCLL